MNWVDPKKISSPLAELKKQPFPSLDILKKCSTFFRHFSSHPHCTTQISAEGKITELKNPTCLESFRLDKVILTMLPK